MTNQIILPKSSWLALKAHLLRLRTRQEASIVDKANKDDLLFLDQLGLMNAAGQLTSQGQDFCNLTYVRGDPEAADHMVRDAVIDLPATQVLLQSLSGLKNVSTNQARMALVFAGLTEQEVDHKLVNFLTILNAHKIINYDRKNRVLRVLISPKQATAPTHVYVDRSRPYSNDAWIREILRECRGSIMWLDKYFQKEAFEWIWREADADHVDKILIVSVIDVNGIDRVTMDDYKRLKKELQTKGIKLEWRVLEKATSHDFHDRWLLDDASLCYNLPSINSIKSGQRSELHRSPNQSVVKASFVTYFDTAKPVA